MLLKDVFSISSLFWGSRFAMAFTLASSSRPGNSSIGGSLVKCGLPSPRTSNNRRNSSSFGCVRVAKQSKYYAPSFKCLVIQVQSCPLQNIVVFELQSSELLKKTGKSDLQIASFLKKLKHNVSSSMHEYQKKIDVNIEVKAIRLQQGKEHANV
jgi:hypothetical protein